MKKILRAFLLFNLLVAALSASADQGPVITPPNQPVKIGLIAPFTGPFAEWGESIRRGAEIALKDSRTQFSVDYQDDACRPVQALSIAQRFFALENIKYVLGPGCDDCLKAIAPVAARAGAVVFSTGLLGDDVLPAHANVINLATQISGEAKRLGREIVSEGVKRLGIVHGTNSFGEEFALRLKETVEAAGVKTFSESAALGTTDFHALIMRLLQHQPEAVFIHQGEAEMIAFVRQLRELRPALPVFSYYSIETESFLKAGSEVMNGVTYTYPLNSAESSGEKQAFDLRFKESFGAKAFPSATSYYVYDGIMLLDRALQACGPDDSECVLKFFRSAGAYQGLSGSMTFRADGANDRPYGIKRLVDGKFLWISKAASPVTKIGVSLPLTGNSALWGADMKNGLLFANQDLAGGQYELIIEDDRCSGKDAVAVAQKFINIDRVKWVLGYGCTGALLSAAPLYEKAGVVVIGTGVASPLVSQAGDYIFRTWPSDANLVQVLLGYLGRHNKSVGMLSEQTDYAQSILAAFKAGAGPSLTILNEDFLSSESDFRSSLARLQSRRIDGLFINTQSEFTYLAALKQARVTMPSIQVYGTSMPGSSAFVEKAGAMANGIIYADLPKADEVLDQSQAPVYRRFLAEYGKPASWDTGVLTAYEAFRAMHLAVQSGREPRDFLYQTTFHGLFGSWSFDRNGDIQGLGNVLKVIKNGAAARLVEKP